MHPTIFALKRAYLSTSTELDRTLEPYDLTGSQLDVLVALDRLGPVRQDELGEALGVSGATLARMLRAMEARQHVRRETDPGDARRKTVDLTPRGADRLDAVREDADAFTERCLDGLSHADVYRLTRLLRRVAENMGDSSQDIYS